MHNKTVKMFKVRIIILLFTIYFAVVSSLSSGKLEGILQKKVKYLFCGSRSCPPWKCQDDSAVIHGYCCGCPGSEYDNVPVPCYPDLKCPMSPEPLCSDYNFMMNCCCTGP